MTNTMGTRAARLGGLVLAVITTFGVTACGDDDPVAPGGGGLTIVPAQNSGGDQVAAPGQAFGSPFTVQVLVDGIPTGGVEIQWAPTDGAANPPTSVSGSNGIATTNWTLGGTSSLKGGDGALSSAEVAKVVSITASAPAVSSGTTAKINAFSVPLENAVVEVSNNAFVPVRPGGATSIVAGTSVTWVWVSDATSHNVSPTSGSALPLRSGEPRDGPYVYTQLFETVGNFTYDCTVHGATGMTGSINVTP